MGSIHLGFHFYAGDDAYTFGYVLNGGNSQSNANMLW